MKRILELYAESTARDADWSGVVAGEYCPYLDRKCVKIRKSQPEISIGTCTVSHGRDHQPVVICPHRLLEKNRVFIDSIHLLSDHEPGNEFHVVPEVSVPGGKVDYFLISARGRRVRDFVAIELQTMDTTGTVWPTRQKFLQSAGVAVSSPEDKTYGINWKMTAKTTLVQMHHKVQTLETMDKRLVLVVQDCLLEYFRAEFSFDHVSEAAVNDSLHIHAYTFEKSEDETGFLDLSMRLSTDAEGVLTCLGLKSERRPGFDDIVRGIENRLSDQTVLSIV